jgi:hypothetical protein
MRIFISYKRNREPDQSLARALETHLSRADHDVFRDETGIHSGTEWARRIQQSIATCDMFVSLVSNDSLESGWVLNEIDFARKRGKAILPILIEPLNESIEFQEYIPRFYRSSTTTMLVIREQRRERLLRNWLWAAV